MKLHEKIRMYRLDLHLSQEYVAKHLGMGRVTYTNLENGKRKITLDNVNDLCQLFGVTPDSLLNEEELSESAEIFAVKFDKLSEDDKAEIMNIIRFKEHLREKNNLQSSY